MLDRALGRESGPGGWSGPVREPGRTVSIGWRRLFNSHPIDLTKMLPLVGCESAINHEPSGGVVNWIASLSDSNHLFTAQSVSSE